MSTLFLEDEAATLEYAKECAKKAKAGDVIYLVGQLGAGKTTFVRGFLRALGHKGSVKSPTYTILETYDLDPFHIVHLDLYRVKDPAELEFLGLDDYFSDPSTVALIEWPSYGKSMLPSATSELTFKIVNEGREVTET